MTEQPAGRELDYEIARLMGDRLIKRGRWKGYWDCGKGRHYSDEDGGPLHYSEDIAAAWRVVGKCEVFYAFSIRTVRDASDYKYVAELMPLHSARYKVPDTSYRAYGETAPLAICRAALAALS